MAKKAKRPTVRRPVAKVKFGAKAFHRPVDGGPYHHRSEVTGGSESRNWEAASAHSYVNATRREVYVWIKHKTVGASLCVRVWVPRGDA